MAINRLFYDEAYKTIEKYAPEMLPFFADSLKRFPRGGAAATAVNYLNDRAEFWYGIDASVAKQIVDVATEIIVRSD